MNYMSEVANMLGVELEEEFRTNEFDDFTFKLTEDGLRWKCDDSWKWQDGFFTLEDILCNRVEIVKKPKPILTAEEKEYLSNVIKSFRSRVNYIAKYCAKCCINNSNTVKPLEFILVEYEDYDGTAHTLDFPYFEKGTMYKGMEPTKEYALKDLDL